MGQYLATNTHTGSETHLFSNNRGPEPEANYLPLLVPRLGMSWGIHAPPFVSSWYAHVRFKDRVQTAYPTVWQCHWSDVTVTVLWVSRQFDLWCARSIRRLLDFALLLYSHKIHCIPYLTIFMEIDSRSTAYEIYRILWYLAVHGRLHNYQHWFLSWTIIV